VFCCEKHMYLRVQAYLVLSLAVITGCSAKRIVTVEQVTKMIDAQLHSGSSKQDVVAFFGALKIDSLRVVHTDVFHDAEELRFDNFDDEKKIALGDRLKEYYGALIRDVTPSTETFETCIAMRFYFDKDGKLLDYTVKEDGVASSILCKRSSVVFVGC
jgi:hypothetical protein